jgi:flagellar biosynthesis chaperone FliJ
MKAPDVKLKALQTKVDLEEQQCLVEKNKISLLVEQRKLILEEVQSKQAALMAKIENSRKNKYKQLKQGDSVNQIAGSASFLQRISSESEELSVLIIEKQAELDRAVERLQSVETDLLEIKKEKKKLEKLLESRVVEQVIRKEAHEEILVDEMSGSRDKR